MAAGRGMRETLRLPLLLGAVWLQRDTQLSPPRALGWEQAALNSSGSSQGTMRKRSLEDRTCGC